MVLNFIQKNVKNNNFISFQTIIGFNRGLFFYTSHCEICAKILLMFTSKFTTLMLKNCWNSIQFPLELKNNNNHRYKQDNFDTSFHSKIIDSFILRPLDV